MYFDIGNLSGHLALIYPPWTSGSEALARAAAAGHQLVGAGRYPFIVIVAPPSGAAPMLVPDSGALLTLAADGFGGCLKSVRQVMS